MNIVAQYVRLFIPNVHQGFWREKKNGRFFLAREIKMVDVHQPI
jgi:hypothetical protein